MGALTSRQNAAVEETDNVANHAYKYPPKNGNYFSSHFIMGGERFDTAQPEAYLFGENADLNFLGSKPTAFPYPPPQANEPTKTLKSLCNIRKETVRFVKASDNVAKSPSEGTVNKGSSFNIEFIFDSDVKCSITIYYFSVEDIGPSCVTYHARDPTLTSATFHYKKGASQVFCQPTHVFNPSAHSEADLMYSPERDVYPIVIHCAVEEGYDDIRQSHSTICVVDHHADGTYVLRALKQKIYVDGLCYLLQEIYGIENKNLNKSISDDEGEENGSECVICMSDLRDTLILPCRHLCLCKECANSLRYQANNCPICRAPFRALLQIRAVQKNNSGANNLIIAPNHQGDDIDIPPGYTAVSLIEALNGPSIKHRPVTPINTDSNTQGNETTTSFTVDSRSGTLEKNKTGGDKKGSLREKSNGMVKVNKDETGRAKETKHSPTLVRSSSAKDKTTHEKIASRSQSTRDCIKLVNEKTPNTLLDNDDDSEAEKLSPLLNNKVVKIPAKKALANVMQMGNCEENIDDVDLSDVDVAMKKKKHRSSQSMNELDTAGGTVGDDSDYYTPEDPHTTILSPVSTEKPINGRENLNGSKETNINTPISMLKDNAMSLPDSPLSGNSQASRSSGDSYSSSSSTKQLLSSVISASNDLPTHISGVDHIRMVDDDKKNKSNTTIVNV